MRPIDIHLVTWNRQKMTELVIKTIHQNTNPGTFKLHVWDNGSEKPMKAMLGHFWRQGLIHTLQLSKSNHGLEAAREQLRLYKIDVESKYFVCVDNDCLPQPIFGNVDWLQRSVMLMEKYPDFGAISLRTQVMIGTGNIFEEADKVGDDIVEFPWPGGSFRIMRTEAVEKVGGWADPKQGRGAEERYIGGKLNGAGYRTAFAVSNRCLHLFGLRDGTTDRWGYDRSLEPADSGHNDIAHPALTNGDDIEEIARYAGKELTDDYCSNKR